MNELGMPRLTTTALVVQRPFQVRRRFTSSTFRRDRAGVGRVGLGDTFTYEALLLMRMMVSHPPYKRGTNTQSM